MRLNGFTLVELTVVIGIVAILAAVVAPRMVAPSTFNVAAVRESVMSVVRQAQKRAIAERRTIFVNVSALQVQICRVATQPCPAGQEVRASSGGQGTLSVGIMPAVTLAGSSFSFTSSGLPSGVGILTLTSGTDSSTITVEAGTGYVHD